MKKIQYFYKMFGAKEKKYHVYSTTLNYTIFVNFVFLYSTNMHIYVNFLFILSIIYINIYILIFKKRNVSKNHFNLHKGVPFNMR